MLFIISMSSVLPYSGSCSKTSQTFRIITGDEESRLQLRLDSKNLLASAARVGECIEIVVTKTSQTAIVQHGVKIILDCSNLLRSQATIMSWYKTPVKSGVGVTSEE